jgi:DNA-binding NarL/FixJ family response regulator
MRKPPVRLTLEQKNEIVQKVKEGRNRKDLAKEYNTSASNIAHIIKGSQIVNTLGTSSLDTAAKKAIQEEIIKHEKIVKTLKEALSVL